MKFFDSLVERFVAFCKKMVEFDKKPTVEINVRGFLVQATPTGERRGNSYRVHYEDPNGYPHARWVELTPEQIAALGDGEKPAHTS